MKRPGVGLSVIVMRDKQVLLGKRLGSHGAGTWAFPGGHIEYMERLWTCASRELMEETGLDEKNIKLIDKYPVAVTNDFFPNVEKHYITLFIRAEHLSGIPVRKEKDKCGGWDWFYWNNLPSPLFTPVGNLLKQNYNPFKK